MELTDRERRIVDHLSEVARGKMMTAKMYEDRGGFETMAVIQSASAGGLCIAIATLTDSTPAQVEDQLAAEIA